MQSLSDVEEAVRREFASHALMSDGRINDLGKSCITVLRSIPCITLTEAILPDARLRYPEDMGHFEGRYPFIDVWLDTPAANPLLTLLLTIVVADLKPASTGRRQKIVTQVRTERAKTSA